MPDFRGDYRGDFRGSLVRPSVYPRLFMDGHARFPAVVPVRNDKQNSNKYIGSGYCGKWGVCDFYA